MGKSQLRSLVWRMVVAAGMGFLSVPLFFALEHAFPFGHGALSLTMTFIAMAVYFFTCQFFLSRGHPNALFNDWPIMLALNTVWIIILIAIAVPFESLEVVLSMGLGILLSCFGCTLAGAFMASMRARRKATAEAS